MYSASCTRYVTFREYNINLLTANHVYLRVTTFLEHTKVLLHFDVFSYMYLR